MSFTQHAANDARATVKDVHLAYLNRKVMAYSQPDEQKSSIQAIVNCKTRKMFKGA